MVVEMKRCSWFFAFLAFCVIIFNICTKESYWFVSASLIDFLWVLGIPILFLLLFLIFRIPTDLQ